MARGRHDRFRIAGTDIYEAQWAVLELLEPGWLLLSRTFCHYHTRHSLVNRGWVEVRDRGDYLMVRLTKAGRQVRDAVYVKQARVADRRLHGRPSKVWPPCV